MQKSRLYILGLITLIGFPLIGGILVYFLEDDPFSFRLPHHYGIGIQLVTGILAGCFAALVAWKIIHLPFMRSTQLKYSNMIRQFDMNLVDIIFLSACAGIGEELLFRGAIQPYLGIYITSVIFVAIHGYLNPKDWRISIYGMVMTLLIVGISYMNDYIGILSAIVAHFTIDLVLLLLINKHKLYEN